MYERARMYVQSRSVVLRSAVAKYCTASAGFVQARMLVVITVLHYSS
jgi:hypothetical protein